MIRSRFLSQFSGNSWTKFAGAKSTATAHVDATANNAERATTSPTTPPSLRSRFSGNAWARQGFASPLRALDPPSALPMSCNYRRDGTNYIAATNPDSARRIARTIVDGVASLHTFPNRGRAALAALKALVSSCSRRCPCRCVRSAGRGACLTNPPRCTAVAAAVGQNGLVFLTDPSCHVCLTLGRKSFARAACAETNVVHRCASDQSQNYRRRNRWPEHEPVVDHPGADQKVRCGHKREGHADSG